MNNQLNAKFSVLEERHQTDRRLGRLANRLRVSGIVTVALALVAIFGARQSNHPQAALAIDAMIVVGSVGFGVALAAEALWRVLRSVTSVDEMEF